MKYINNTIRRTLLTTVIFFSGYLFSSYGFSQDNISHAMGDYTTYYNVFNSSHIPSDIAADKNLARADNRAYVNIALVKNSGGYGTAAYKLSGAHRNLMQQKFPLEFIEIKEATATYYLAPIRFNNEEVLHIDIIIQATETSSEETFTITKKMYRD